MPGATDVSALTPFAQSCPSLPTHQDTMPRLAPSHAALAAALTLIPFATADAAGTPHAHRAALVKRAAGGNGNGNGNANGATNGNGQGNGNGQSNGNAGGSGNGQGNGNAQGPGNSGNAQGNGSSGNSGNGNGNGGGNGTAATPPSTSATPTPAPADPGAPAAGSAALTPALSLGTTATAPTLGTAVGLAQVSGRVVVRTSAGTELQDLPAAAAVPVGTHIDARQGTVELASAVTGGNTPAQVGRFTGGIFEVRQAPGGYGVTQLVLVGGAWGACDAKSPAAVARTATATATKKRKPVRSLWGSDDGGKFQSRGRGSVATVRGTRWLTEDFCTGTRTTVTQGAVSVHDLRKHKTVTVTAGHSYFAAAPRTTK